MSYTFHRSCYHLRPSPFVVLPASLHEVNKTRKNRLLAPILTAYDHAQYLTLAKFVLPQISQRLEQLEQLGKEQLPRFDGEEHVSHNRLPVLAQSLLLRLTLA